MEAADVLDRLAALGITARASGEKLLLEPGSKVPPELLAEVRHCKAEVLTILKDGPDYAATACVCPMPVGPTGPDRCNVCKLALLCPGCGLCRGCKLRLRFPRGVYWK